MLGVIICDDDRFMMETSAKLARKCIADDKQTASVVCVADNYSETLVYIEKNPGSYLYFIDIVRDTIENALERLGGGFMKSHRCVVINQKHVASVSDGFVRFAGGETAACSFRMKNEVIKKCGVKRT